MIKEMYIDIYEELYEEMHLQGLKLYEVELAKVLTKNEDDVA
jgi:hypothetical protein